MVRRRACTASNHEARGHPSRRGQKAAPLDEVLFVTILGITANDALAFCEFCRSRQQASRAEKGRAGSGTTMKSPVCDMLGVEFPLFAFSHCRDVVAAVSRAGGFGVLGATAHSPESIERELKWIDAHVDGKPYGLDVLIPENISTSGEKGVTWKSLEARVSPEHRAFTKNLLKKYGVELTTSDIPDHQPQPFDASRALEVLEAAFRHPIRLIANALGVPPKAMIEMGRKHGVPVAALVGAKEHALRQVAAGVDILVVQGTEAGGHCGEVSTMVLVPEVIKAIKKMRDVPVLAAGGIMTGRQMAACMAMGAAGVWTGSVWLATVESETTEIFREKMIAASSRDAVRSRGRTGKPARQLRSVWTDAWDRDPNSPGALPMPLQSIISRDAFASIDRAAAAGNAQARDLVSYFVGQGVGLIDSVKSATAVVQEFKEEFAEAVEHMNTLVGE
jgi:NAD(P)H-dependent flavin oxidoreductase YrpB (nitropropane dioxygenase family)